MQLVLSLFPGIDLLGLAFKREGFCVVQGGDVIWGGDIREEHYPAGRFDGVIGGPPCQAFSELVHLNRSMGVEPKFGNLTPEFERCVSEARPRWFLMENVLQAPIPEPTDYLVYDFPLSDCECGGETQRDRRISFGAIRGIYSPLQFELRLRPANHKPRLAVTGSARAISVGGTIRRNDNGKSVEPGYSRRLSVEQMAIDQGLPADFLGNAPFTTEGKRKVLGNGVPLPMGRAIARAVKEATEC